MTCPYCLRPCHACKWVSKTLLMCPACEHEWKQLGKQKTLDVSKAEQLEMWEVGQITGGN